MYDSISGISSQAFTRDWNPAQGSGEEMLAGDAASGGEEIAAGSGSVTGSGSGGAGSGGGLGGLGSAKTRVGFGAFPSHGKIGFGLSCSFRFSGTW